MSSKTAQFLDSVTFAVVSGGSRLEMVTDRHGATWLVVPDELEGQSFAIEVSNNTNSRRGVGVALDGLNVITGQPHYGGPDDDFYIYTPNLSRPILGWRVGQDSIREFTWKSVGESYAAQMGFGAGHTTYIGFVVLQEERPRFGRGGLEATEILRGGGGGSLESRGGVGMGQERASRVSAGRMVPVGAPSTFEMRWGFRRDLIAAGVIAAPAPGAFFRREPRGFCAIPPSGPAINSRG